MPEGELTYQKLWDEAEKKLLREVKLNEMDLVTLAQNLETNINELKGLLDDILGKVSDEKAGDIILRLAEHCPKSPEEVLEAALNPSSSGASAAKDKTDKSCSYVEFMNLLKETVSKYSSRNKREEFCRHEYKNNQQQARRCVEKVEALTRSPLLDTCYDKDRVEKLQKGLDALKKINGCGLVALLLASYAVMLKGVDNVFERVEWVPLLLRAVARKEDEKAYIPVCPGKGDVAAVAYYILLNCSKGGGGQGGT